MRVGNLFEPELTTEKRAIIAEEMQEAPQADMELRVAVKYGVLKNHRIQEEDISHLEGLCKDTLFGGIDLDAKATMIQKHLRGWQAYKQVHALIDQRRQHRPDHPDDTSSDSCEYKDPLYCLPARFLDRAYYFIRENQRYVLAMDPEQERHFIDIRDNPFEKKLVRPYHISNSDLALLDRLTENSYFFKKSLCLFLQ